MAIDDRLVTYRGDTKSIKAWAEEMRLTPKTLRRRIERADKGIISLDAAFTEAKPKLAPGSTLAAGHVNGNVGGKGKRVRAIEALFDSFIAEGLPRIPDEMRRYMATGEIGNAMNFYIKYQSFFPKEKLETLDECTTKQMASVAVVFADKPPENITIIEQ